ncbi:hypothetical protein [Labilibaculum euxinus]
MENLVGILIGLPIGIIASLLAWWLLTHAIVPKVTFAPFLSKITDSKNNFRYRIGFKNSGVRAMIDVQIIFELVIKGFDKTLPTNTSYIQLNLKKPKLYKVSKNTRWALTIDTKELPKSLAEYKGASLEDLLRIENAKARVIIFGYDKYSGTRKMFESQKYIIADIKDEKFDKKYYE